MYKSLALSVVTLGLATGAQAQTTLAKWTFETSGPAYNTAVTAASIAGVVPEVGLGTAGGVHVSASTAWSSPVGNGSTESLSANGWAVGDYWQFQVNTSGYLDIALSFDQTSSGTGPRDFSLQYSTDGSAFTSFASYSLKANSAPISWTSSTAYPDHTYSFDLSGITLIENSAQVWFRLVNSSTASANGGTTASGGTSRVDNFTVVSIPEPGTAAIICLGFAGFLIRRRS